MHSNMRYKTNNKSACYWHKNKVKKTKSKQLYLNIFEKSVYVKGGILNQWEKYKWLTWYFVGKFAY